MAQSTPNARKVAIENMLGKNRQVKKPLIQPVPGNQISNTPNAGAYQRDFQNRRK